MKPWFLLIAPIMAVIGVTMTLFYWAFFRTGMAVVMTIGCWWIIGFAVYAQWGQP
jgi:hypothetical protein